MTQADAHDHNHEPQTQQPHEHGAFASETVPVRILVVCWANSARSILAEALFKHYAGTRLEVYSAGIEPAPVVHPMAIQVLQEAGLPTDGLHPKSVNDFLGQRFDYVITVCDDSRGVCPVFPGVQQSLHWGYPDPAKLQGTDAERLAAIRAVFTGLGTRIHQFLPIADRFAAERSAVELA